MESNNSNKDGKIKGWITTAVVHLVLILLMVFFGFTTLNPPLGDVSIGIEGFGDPDAGRNAEAETAEQTQPEPQETSTSASNPQDDPSFLEQNESPVEIKKTKPVKTTPKTEEKKEVVKTEPKKEEPKVDDRLKDMAKLLQGPNNSGGAGDGKKDGNKGGETGDAGGGTGKGNKGAGDGMFDFGGRKAVKAGNLSHNCNADGTVMVRVTVNRNGDVINAEIAAGGTTANECLRARAKEAAYATKYSANPNGPAQQVGNIELYFQLK
jgi:protein TonB